MSEPLTAEEIAAAFHESYERQAPDFGYRTRESSAKPWQEVPDQNKRLMVAVVNDLMRRNVIGGGHRRMIEPPPLEPPPLHP